MEYYVRQCLVGVPHISIHLSLDDSSSDFDDVSTLRSSFLARCLPCGPGEMRAESKVYLTVPLSVSVSVPVFLSVFVPLSVSASPCLCLSMCAHTFLHTYIEYVRDII